ncbi:ATP-binding cassette domain-containing protein [Streptomyces sp. NPDC017958]|uniref:ATP-binding cassette domain-containing protein n=1 Tax=Streptomyces sp. NPDC017958 TaxID=3365021 RepID=UPI0037AD9EA8
MLDDFTLEIAPGRVTGVVGATGSGKTVARLLMRVQDAQSGRVPLDGQDVRDLARRDLRAAVGFVAQDPFQFDGTIADNFRYGRLHRRGVGVRGPPGRGAPLRREPAGGVRHEDRRAGRRPHPPPAGRHRGPHRFRPRHPLLRRCRAVPAAVRDRAHDPAGTAPRPAPGRRSREPAAHRHSGGDPAAAAPAGTRMTGRWSVAGPVD